MIPINKSSTRIPRIFTIFLFFLSHASISTSSSGSRILFANTSWLLNLLTQISEASHSCKSAIIRSADQHPPLRGT